MTEAARLGRGSLYRNTIDCIVAEGRHGLYCNIVTVPTTRLS